MLEMIAALATGIVSQNAVADELAAAATGGPRQPVAEFMLGLSRRQGVRALEMWLPGPASRSRTRTVRIYWNRRANSRCRRFRCSSISSNKPPRLQAWRAGDASSRSRASIAARRAW